MLPRFSYSPFSCTPSHSLPIQGNRDCYGVIEHPILGNVLVIHMTFFLWAYIHRIQVLVFECYDHVVPCSTNSNKSFKGFHLECDNEQYVKVFFSSQNKITRNLISQLFQPLGEILSYYNGKWFSTHHFWFRSSRNLKFWLNTCMT